MQSDDGVPSAQSPCYGRRFCSRCTDGDGEVPDRRSHVGIERKKCPTAHSRTQEAITASVCVSTRQFSLDKYLIFACSRAFLLLVEGDFFQEDWQETRAGPRLQKMKQIPEAKPYRYLHQPSLHSPWPVIMQFIRQELPSAAGRLLRRRLWQLLCPARAGPCSAVIFKESAEGNCAQDRVISMGHSTMSGCNPTAS